MKLLFILVFPSITLLSCSSHRQPEQRIVSLTPEPTGRVLPRQEMSQVRHAETVKAYPVGRYVDPRRRGVMHEAHTIYRVESPPQWNLTRPRGTVSTSTLPSPRPAAPSGSELTVELNRQRQATQAVMRSGQAVSDKLAEMTAALEQNRVLAEQNAAIQQELQASRRRLEALERDISNRPLNPEPEGGGMEEEPW